MSRPSISDTFSRRDFLRTASVVGAATLAGSLTPGALRAAFAPIRRVGGPNLKVSLNAYSFGKLLNDHALGRGAGMSLFDKARGEFLIHFLPLTIDPAESGPQGFNGSHLHHPVSDAPPRGLGLECSYESIDIRPTPAEGDPKP